MALVLSAPQTGKDAVITSYSNENIGVDGYQYSVQTSDGKSAQESGVLKNPGSENEGIAAQGEFSYIGEDGVTYKLTYIADENGFQPQGAHLPH